jgi:hypothetical protein
MSFHWVDQAIGLPKLGRVVRPGGRVAIWWTVFRDPEWPDAFEEASRERLAAHGIHPHQQPQFELDVVRRVDDLTQHAGLGEVEAELIRWTVTMTASEVRALYGSMINVLRRPEPDRLKLLDGLEQIASEEFGGVVERSFVTALYSARRP